MRQSTAGADGRRSHPSRTHVCGLQLLVTLGLLGAACSDPLPPVGVFIGEGNPSLPSFGLLRARRETTAGQVAFYSPFRGCPSAGLTQDEIEAAVVAAITSVNIVAVPTVSWKCETTVVLRVDVAFEAQHYAAATHLTQQLALGVVSLTLRGSPANAVLIQPEEVNLDGEGVTTEKSFAETETLLWPTVTAIALVLLLAGYIIRERHLRNRAKSPASSAASSETTSLTASYGATESGASSPEDTKSVAKVVPFVKGVHDAITPEPPVVMAAGDGRPVRGAANHPTAPPKSILKMLEEGWRPDSGLDWDDYNLAANAPPPPTTRPGAIFPLGGNSGTR